MTAEIERARREASEWHVLLHDAPEDSGLRARFARWHDADARHAAAWQSIDRTIRTIAAVSEAGEAGIHDAGPGRGRDAPWSRGRRRLFALAAACAALLVVVQVPDLVVRASSDYATAAAETKQIVLADGSTVELAPQSAIAVAFTDARREVRLLSGTAHFRIVPNPDRPFDVAANGVTASVLGTEFDVGLPGDGAVVEVKAGHVRVAGTDDRAFEAIDLRAGDWFRIDADRQVTTGRAAADFVGAWSSGRLMVRGQPIAAVVERIRPWFAGKIVLLDSTLGARRVTGVYDLHDPGAALEALVSPYGGTVTQVTPWALVISGG